MSPPHFNLVDEPWIPTEGIDGRARLVGLAELFESASSLRRIVDPSPLVTVGLYRLAFAVFHRAVAITDQMAWEDAWDAMDASQQLTAYLQAWRHRFDLFDADAPFWQVSDQSEDQGVMAWTKLAPALNDNNNKVLFDHTVTGNPPPATPAQIARSLIACQMFALGGGNTRLGYSFDAPLARALAVVPEAPTLIETLFANAQPTQSPDDAPVWEQPPLTVHDVITRKGETWNGIASRLTWPSRAVRVLPDRIDDTGEVRWISFAAGVRFTVVEGDRDPWVAYRVARNGNRVPLRLLPERMVWRDLHAMIAGSEDGLHEAVAAVSRLAFLENADRPTPAAWRLLVAGQASNQARVDAWRQERWSLPESVLHDKHRIGVVADAIRAAENTGETVWRHTWRIAHDLTARDGHVDPSEVTARAKSMPTGTAYWSGLERRFPEFLARLSGDALQARQWWLESIAETLRESARATHAALGRDARALRAWARTGPRFESAARRLQALATRKDEGEA